MGETHPRGWRPDLEHDVYGKTDGYTPDDSRHVRHDLPINIDELEQHRRAQFGFEPVTLEELKAQHQAKLEEAGLNPDNEGPHA